MSAKIGDVVDELYKMDERIDQATAIIGKLKRIRDKLEKKLLDKFGTQKVKGATGKVGVAAIDVKEYPSIKDRVKFQKYVKKRDAFDLFQARINSKAYFDRIEEGESIPGIRVFEKVKVKVTKRKSKRG